MIEWLPGCRYVTVLFFCHTRRRNRTSEILIRRPVVRCCWRPSTVTGVNFLLRNDSGGALARNPIW